MEDWKLGRVDGCRLVGFCREYGCPVVFHVNDDPSVGVRLLECLIQFADYGRAIVRVFSVGIGVVDY